MMEQITEVADTINLSRADVINDLIEYGLENNLEDMYPEEYSQEEDSDNGEMDEDPLDTEEEDDLEVDE